MVKQEQITINGKRLPLSVCLRREINLNWRETAAQQTGFQVRVLDDTDTIIYDSMKKYDDTTFHTFRLPLAHERTRYAVIVTLFCADGIEKEVSTSFLSENNQLGQAHWITRLDNPIEKEANFLIERNNIILEKTIIIEEEVKDALIDICGLGYYTLYVNDQRVKDYYLNSDVTNYDKAVYYDTFDIKSHLTKGKNKVSVELANGWYNPAPINILGKYNVRKQLAVGKPCLICQIAITTATDEKIRIDSDRTWQSKAGAYLFNNIYIGEVVTDDFSKESSSEKTVRVPGPAGKLTPNFIPKVRRQKQYNAPVVTIDAVSNSLVVDFGTIMSGHFQCDIKADVIGEITFLYAEEMNADGTLNYSSCISGNYGINDAERGIAATDAIIQKDVIQKQNRQAFHFENQYVYHSFRYVQVRINPEVSPIADVLSNISASSVYTDLEATSRFESSSEEVNTLWHAAINTRLSNIHSYFEDCTRERFGYGGDIVALLDSHLYSHDVQQLLKKVFLDFYYDQTPEGGIPQTAPYVGIMTNGPSNGAGSLGWQMVFPVIAAKMEHFYHNPSFVTDNLPALEKHLHYLLQFDFDYIRYCCLGDWGSIDVGIKNKMIVSPDQEFCSACMYLILLEEYKNLFSTHVVSAAMMDELEQRIKAVRSSIVTLFRNEDGSFSSGSQSSYIFALKAQLFKDEQEKNTLEGKLIQSIREDGGIFRFGIFGMSWAYQLLSDLGEDEMIYQWLSRTQEPNYLSMLENGNQTLGEYFPIKNKVAAVQGSLNHAMFSSYTVWLMEKLVGISIKNKKGLKPEIKLSPYFAKDIAAVSGSLATIQGEVKVRWERTSNSDLVYSVVIPKSLDYDLAFGEDVRIFGKEVTSVAADQVQIRLILGTPDTVEAAGWGNS